MILRRSLSPTFSKKYSSWFNIILKAEKKYRRYDNKQAKLIKMYCPELSEINMQT